MGLVLAPRKGIPSHQQLCLPLTGLLGWVQPDLVQGVAHRPESGILYYCCYAPTIDCPLRHGFKCVVQPGFFTGLTVLVGSSYDALFVVCVYMHAPIWSYPPWLGTACSIRSRVLKVCGLMHVQLTMLKPILNQAVGLQGDSGVDWGTLVAKNLGIGSGWQQSRQN